jgi:hypothetical protein
LKCLRTYSNIQQNDLYHGSFYVESLIENDNRENSSNVQTKLEKIHDGMLQLQTDIGNREAEEIFKFIDFKDSS